MPEEINKSSQNENPERRLNGRAIVSHNRHIQDGRARSQRCGICENGLQAAVEVPAAVKSKPQADEVVQGSGGDEEGPTAPASAGGWYWR